MMHGPSMTVSKEMVRLRLYALCLAGDMAGLFGAFLAANWLVLGALCAAVVLGRTRTRTRRVTDEPAATAPAE